MRLVLNEIDNIIIMQNNYILKYVNNKYMPYIHTGKCKSTVAGCNELVQSKLRTGIRLKWRKR